MASGNNRTNRRSTNPNRKVVYRSAPIKRRTRKSSFSLTDPTTVIALIGVLGLIISLKVLGLLLTIALIIGVGLIIGFCLLNKKLRKTRKGKTISNILIIGVLGIILAILVASVAFIIYVIKKAPEFDTDKLNRSQTTIIYDKDKKEIASLGTERREIIKYDDMSQSLVDALIATEDSRFYQHNGFDAARFLKASVGQAAGSNAGGASTLSMQVIKNSFTSTEAHGIQGIIRKFTDIYLAIFKLEKNYTKEEIIEFYVNNHYLGSNAYGVEEASQTYFGKSARELNTSEAALLVGLFQAPTYYNPFTHPERANTRRNTVLKYMNMHGYITKEEMALAASIPVESLLVENSGDGSTPYQAYVDTVVEEAIDKYKVNPYNTSLLIYTNMDTKKQKGIDNIFSGKTFQWENKIVQGGVAAVDVKTGKILAIGAGRNRTDARSYNFATMIDRQIGSTAKPLFDYAPGIEYNNWSTYEIFDDSPYTYSSGQQMRNSDRSYMGPITLRTALAQSRNVPALKAFQSVENKKIIDMVTKMGIKPEVTNGKIHEAHSIGSFNGSNPLAMAAAYATFANGGYYNEPYSIEKMEFRDSGETVEHKGESVKVMSDSTAFMITDCLVSAVTSGVSNGAAIDGVHIAAKTGTTNYSDQLMSKYGLPDGTVNDAWIVGFDPDVALGMWYGYEKIDKRYHSTTTSAVVQRSRLYKAAGNVVFSKNGKDFKVPDSVVKLGIERGSNPARVASAGTPEDMIVYEYFKKGTEPTDTSSTYIKLSNISNLKHTFNNNTLTLTWSRASSLDDAEDSWGKLGYKVYKNGKYLGFVTTNSYTINTSSPVGTYKIVTSYEKNSSKDSNGATITVKSNATKNKQSESSNLYTRELKVSSSKTYHIGDSLDSSDQNPSASDIRVYENGIDITSKCDISAVITVNGADATITNTETATYVIAYSIKYNGKTIVEPLTRTVKIVE